MGISFTPFAATCDHNFIANLHEIFEDHASFFIDEHGSGWNFEHNVFAPFAVAAGALSVLAFFTTPEFAVGKANERVYAFASAEDDAATIATVTAAGATLWYVFFTQESNAPVAPFTGMEFHFNSIDKHVWPQP
jgi:hypothetical protein